jgi:hypothetical protein
MCKRFPAPVFIWLQHVQLLVPAYQRIIFKMSGLWGRELAASSYLVTGTSSAGSSSDPAAGWLAGSGQILKNTRGMTG